MERFCSSTRAASTRSSPRSRSPRTPCSPGRSSPPTTPTRSRRSPVSCRCRRSAGSTGTPTSRRCRRTSTAPATTSRSRARTSCRWSCGGCTRPASQGDTEFTIYGTGTPREFLHADDLAAACLLLLERYDDPAPINVGWGTDVTINELVAMIAESSATAAVRPRPEQAGRDAAEGPGRRPDPGARLGADDRAARRHRRGLPLVCRAPDDAADVIEHLTAGAPGSVNADHLSSVRPPFGPRDA